MTMKNAFIGSSIGIVAIAITIPTIIHLNLPKFEAQLQKDVVAWNTKLPEGYRIQLDNECSISNCTGRYNLFSETEEDKERLEMYLDFKTKFNPLSFILPNSEIPITGNVTLANKELINDNLITQFNIKNNYLLTFEGYVQRNGKMDISFVKNPVEISISEEDSPPLLVIKDTEPSIGKLKYDKYSLEINVDTPHVLISSSTIDSTGLDFSNIVVKSRTDLERKTPTSTLETTGEIFIKKLQDTSINRILDAKNLLTTFSFNEGTEDFTHHTVLKADEFNHADIGKLSYLLDYEIKVPLASKQSLIDFLQTIQTSDMETRQGAFYEILKNGFDVNLKDFHVVEHEQNNSIQTNFNLHMDKAEDGKSFPDRTFFDASLHSKGQLASYALDMTGFNIESLISDKEVKTDLSKETQDPTATPEKPFEYKLNISYKNGGISFNNKPVDKVFSPMINTSLISLENLLKEGEENYKKYKSGDVTALTLDVTEVPEEDETPPEIIEYPTIN